MKTYVKNGYEIQATEKAYKLFYEKQGFKEKTDDETVDPSKMNVKQLKAYCDANGIAYDPKAKQKELQELVLANAKASTDAGGAATNDTDAPGTDSSEGEDPQSSGADATDETPTDQKAE
ncbi:MAG: hypothetical protein PHY47_16010 [Lachnospiraceae bacterium]|nr:hypothetical protein [Lachnospiraceae bacterium]